MLNSLLPKDIRIIAWSPVKEGYSARFDCESRTYKYWFPRGDLDVDVCTFAFISLILDVSHLMFLFIYILFIVNEPSYTTSSWNS